MPFSLGFSGNLLLEDLGPRNGSRRNWYRLTTDLVFSCGFNGGGLTVTVPAGFETDFASCPRALWPIFPPAGEWNRAAVVHDFLYGIGSGCSRFLADAIFRDAMTTLGVPWCRRVLMYYAVRLFGGYAYHSR